jgi:hypothetical protein
MTLRYQDLKVRDCGTTGVSKARHLTRLPLSSPKLTHGGSENLAEGLAPHIASSIQDQLLRVLCKQTRP